MKKIITVIIAIFILANLSGCQLANKQDNIYVDPIQIGYYITTYHLPDGKLVGEKVGGKFVFGNETGYSAFEYYDPNPISVERVIKQVDPAISDYFVYSGLEAKAHARFTNASKDQSEFFETVLFTIYFDAPQVNYIYHNKVYEDYEGNIFVVPESGTGFSLEDKTYIGYKGSIFETSSHPTVLTGNEVVQMTVYTEIKVSTKARVDYYLVHQIDKNQQLLSTLKFSQKDIPDKIIKESAMEYIILEAYTTISEKVNIERKLIERNTATIEVYTVNDDGIFEMIKVPLR